MLECEQTISKQVWDGTVDIPRAREEGILLLHSCRQPAAMDVDDSEGVRKGSEERKK